MGQQSIECTVHSCYYYASGDQCRASAIMVANNPSTIRGQAGTEFGAELGTPQAATSAHTQCRTFIPEGQGPKPGIRRLSD